MAIEEFGALFQYSQTCVWRAWWQWFTLGARKLASYGSVRYGAFAQTDELKVAFCYCDNYVVALNERVKTVLPLLREL